MSAFKSSSGEKNRQIVLENGDIVFVNTETGQFFSRGSLPNYISRNGNRECWVKGTLENAFFSDRKDKAPNFIEFRDDTLVHAWVRGPFATPEFFNPSHNQTLATVSRRDGHWTRAWVQGSYEDPVFLKRKRGRPNWIDSRGLREWRDGDYYAPEYAVRHERPSSVDVSRGLRKYAIGGKLVGAFPVKYRVPWSECSRHAKLQLGGTCASAAALNLFLNTPILRNACISRTLELFEARPGLEEAWKDGDLTKGGSNFQHVLLQTIYYEMCFRRGERVPNTVSFASHCMFSALLTNMGRDWSHYIRNSAVVLDLIYAAGFNHFFFNIPEFELDDAVMKLKQPECTLFFYTRMFDTEGTAFGETTPDIQKGPLSVIGSFITFSKLRDRAPVSVPTPETEAGTGHVVVGLVCKAAATPLIFDSNIGEVEINWMHDADAFFTDFTHEYGKVLFVHQTLLYATIDVHDAAMRLPFASACTSARRGGVLRADDAKKPQAMLGNRERHLLYSALSSVEPAVFIFKVNILLFFVVRAAKFLFLNKLIQKTKQKKY